MKVIIVGGVAGGATAAARIRRLDEQAEIIVFERSGYISYANCGLPYYIGGVIEEAKELTLQTPESFFKRFRIDIKVNHEVIAINNLKYAWQFILEEENASYNFNTICEIHKLVCDKLVLDNDLGHLRATPVNIGGTSWKPQFPIESQIKEELEELLNQKAKTKTEIAIEIMLWLMRRQMFIDGNKRVAMIFANKIMIDNGCGIITIANELQADFFTKLINYYETNDMEELKLWIYNNCIDGINLN